MIGIRKQFDQKLHRQNDPKSRKVVKEFFLKQGILLEDNENKFGVDLISKDDTLQIEIEHRLVWDSNEFPFSEVNVPERKAKFFVENHICYVILSKDYSRIGMIKGDDLMGYLTTENLKESSNKYVRNGEMFFKVPKERFTWLKV